MHRFLGLIIGIMFLFGCEGMKPKADDVDAFEYRYPKKVEWKKPEQVLKSFYGAKKRGDWQKAFSICDFNETLSSAEAKNIREQWKKDSTSWKSRYMFRDYYVVERERSKDTATMIVMEFYDSKDEKNGVGKDEYVETMKKYGGKWKLSAALPKDEELKEKEKQ